MTMADSVRNAKTYAQQLASVQQFVG